jgi:hypothetical protein
MQQLAEGRMPPPARGVLFRNAWPPNWDPPDPALVYVHQQAFEFRGIPSSWVAPLNSVPDDVWVPSAFNKQAPLRGIPSSWAPI